MQVSTHHQPLKSIFLRCDPKALANSSSVCKLWHELIANEEFNKYLLERDYPKTLLPMDAQRTFRQVYLTLQHCHWNMRRGHFEITKSPSGLQLSNASERSPDGKKVLNLTAPDRSFEVVDLENPEHNRTFTSYSRITEVRFLDDAFAISASKRKLKKWDLNTGEHHQVVINAEQIIGVEVARKQNMILTALKSGKIIQWSDQLDQIRTVQSDFSSLSSIAISPDEKIMVIATIGKKLFESYLEFWGLNDEKPLHTVPFENGVDYTVKNAYEFSFILEYIQKIQFAEDGSKLHLCSSKTLFASLDFTL